MKRKYLFLLCFLLVLGACGQKGKNISELPPKYNMEEPILSEDHEEDSVPEAEAAPEFICAEQNAFSQAQEDNWNTGTTYSPEMLEMDEEVIPIPVCASMLNGYYLTRRPYTEALVHFYLVNAATGERQFLLDAYNILAVTPTGLYCAGDESSIEQPFYYSFSQKKALPILYPEIRYETFYLVTYDQAWLYSYCNDEIFRMSRSTGETEVFLDTIPEDINFSYFAIDPEYLYIGETMYPL